MPSASNYEPIALCQSIKKINFAGLDGLIIAAIHFKAVRGGGTTFILGG